MERLPSYADLPVAQGAPPGSAWGVFGTDDRLGTLNLLTPERRAAAAGLARTGRVFNLDWPVNLPAIPFFPHRGRPKHVILSRRNGNTRDDYLDGFYPQYSSQWDGLRHMRNPEYGFYNGTKDEDEASLGIDGPARLAIAGRGVLLDLPRCRVLHPDARDEFPASLLDEVAAVEGVTIRPGDIVLMRTGVDSMLRREAEQGEVIDARDYEGPGLAFGRETLAWLWDRHISAIASDNLSIEAWPMRSEAEFLHFHAIPLLGMTFGELFDLEALAADCAGDGVYEFFFVAKPLLLRGGVGSPANALAIK